MLRALTHVFLCFVLIVTISSAENGFSRCNCEDEGHFWSLESILECQRVSDFLIAVAYFSIPIELVYFISCASIPFKWVIVEFVGFIVLCGMTHLLNSWTFGPHTFQLVLGLAIFKFLTALVSCATAISLVTLIPLLLKVKVRELMLQKKTWDLGREVGLIRRQKEAGLHVRMLTQEIRKSLDRHTILYTTMVELSKTLDLQKCAVWMPNEDKSEVILTHELKEQDFSNFRNLSIPTTYPDVVKIKGSHGVKILNHDSPLVLLGNDDDLVGAVAAIRMPMLRFSNFKGGTPERVQTYYAILVLVLPSENGRSWTSQELEIVNVVADQVAVALSHAAVLEESQFMREKLEQQNHALQQAKKNTLMASQARNSFQRVMGDGMRKPMHSILGLLSIMQKENFSSDQVVIADAVKKTSFVLSSLIDDLMDISPNSKGKFVLKTAYFSLHSSVREISCLAKCLCVHRGVGFTVDVERSLPDYVGGDEKRVFQVVLHMLGHMLHESNNGGALTLRVVLDGGRSGKEFKLWQHNPSEGHVNVKFEATRESTTFSKEGLSYSVCRKLVRLMHGSISLDSDRMTAVLGFQIQSSTRDFAESSQHPLSNSFLRGVHILLAHPHDINRAVTVKLLERLDCSVSSVSSGLECLENLGPTGSSFQIVIFDLHLSDLNGYELAKRIRKLQSPNRPLLIALTSSVDDDDDVWETCTRNGINGVICKPALLEGIASEIRRVLLQANRTML